MPKVFYRIHSSAFATLSAALLLTLCNSIAYSANCDNKVFKRVLSSGKLVVGVKADYNPWGFRNADGVLVGLEIDMAQDIADTMGVTLETVAVQSSNRIQFLQQGKIDILIATMSDRADRRKLVGIPLPNYYSSGTNIMSPKSLNIENWSDLKGKLVCGKHGAFYNKIVTENYGAEILSFNTNDEAKQALRENQCAAWVYDDSSIMSDLISGNWSDYEMPLRTEDSNPWGLAVPLAENECLLGQMMSGLQYNWLRSGKLIEWEKKWGIQSSEFLKLQHSHFADWLVK